jgi:hypothetical protein
VFYPKLPFFWVVAPEVVGSSPITHPSNDKGFGDSEALFLLWALFLGG